MDSWFLVYCKAKQESRAQANLENQGIESFYPTLQVNKLIRGKRTVKTEAMFPNYLFVRLNTQTSNFNALRSTRGVLSFIAYGKKMQQIPNSLISQLKLLKSGSNCADNLPVIGDKVIVNSGAFEAVSAIYKEPDGEKRSVVLINILNKSVQLSVENIAIKAA